MTRQEAQGVQVLAEDYGSEVHAHGHVLPARAWLRGQVQHSAAGAQDPREFLDRPRVAGVAVRERRDLHGTLSGYDVGRHEPGEGTGKTVFYGGRKLAADLSRLKLQARWATAGGSTLPDQGPSDGPSARPGTERKCGRRRPRPRPMRQSRSEDARTVVT